MDMNELDSSLQNMIDLSSSEADDKDELFTPTKKSKGATRGKNSKRPTKYRVRKSADKVTKAASKRYGKLYGCYPNKSFSNGVITEDVNSKFLPESNETAHLLPVVDILEKFNYKYEIKPDVNKQHEDFFLQDKYMNTFFKQYPDYICVDLLCEVIELELNLYLFISVDSNGHCEIISIGLFKSCETGLAWFCEVFKRYNLNWRKMRFIMCDKKARTNEVLKNTFSEKLILISFFHSMKILKKDLFDLESKMSDDDVNNILQIFEQMIFASDESSYAELLKNLKLMPPAISTYFRKTWHQKKDSWVLRQHLNSKVFLKAFNSYLNLVRKTLRPLISTLDSVESLMKTLCITIEQMRQEKFQKFTAVFPQPSGSKQLVSDKYSKLLTSYAVELVSEQICFSSDVKNLKKLAPGKYLYCEDIVTINSCSCNFFQLFTLPCSHIFSVRRCLSLPFYVESLCSFRWISTTYYNAYVELQSVFTENYQKSNPEKSALHLRSFPKYFKISADLWPLLASCPENVSQDRLFVLRNLLRAWEYGLKINIKTSDLQTEQSSSNSTQAEESGDYWKDLYGISLKDILDSDNDISVLPFTI